MIHYCWSCFNDYLSEDSESQFPWNFCGKECEIEYGPIVEEDPLAE